MRTIKYINGNNSFPQLPFHSFKNIEVLQTNPSSHPQLLEKALLLKSIRHRYLIPIHEISQAQNKIIIYYQDIQSLSPPKQNGIIFQLQELIQYLCEVGLKTYLKPQSIRVSKEGNLRYFIGMQFECKKRGSLEKFYKQEMKKIFKTKSIQNSLNYILQQIQQSLSHMKMKSSPLKRIENTQLNSSSEGIRKKKKNTQKTYFSQIIQVFEDSPCKSSNTSTQSDTKELQKRVQSAIKHSKDIMNKFKKIHHL